MKHLLSRGLLVLAFAACSALSAQAADLQLTIHSGRVTLVAKDVPVRQILQEWSRVGQTKIVNAEKVMGPPVTLQLIDVPEKEALDVVLRSVSGYMAAPRAELIANASMYDRIMIMPTSHAPMVSAAPPPAAAPAPFQRPPMPMQVDDDDEPVNVTLPGTAPPPMTPTPNGGVVGAFPGAQPPNAPGAQTPPPLSSQPGVVVGAPSPNGVQPNPNQPAVVRPGGGGPGGPGEGGGQ